MNAAPRLHRLDIRCFRRVGGTYRSQRCRYSSTHDSAPPPRPAPEASFAHLTSRRLISLEGQDAPKYLQGLVATNIPGTQHLSGASYTAFLNAQGRVLHDVFLFPSPRATQDPGYLIEVDAAEVHSLYKHLKRYKLRAKVNLRMMEEGEADVWCLWGQPDHLQGALDQRVPWEDGKENMGCRSILENGRIPDAAGTEVSSQSYDARRMQMGVPEGQSEILKETALPQESNIDYMGGIDFRKGCYVGQELTIRTHHTGVVRKRILPVQLYSGSEGMPTQMAYHGDKTPHHPPPGANISRVDKKGRSAGKWLGGVGNIGLALCRLEIMTDQVLVGESSQWTPDDQFKITWTDNAQAEQEVRVRAFTPWWHAIRAAEQSVQRPNS